MKHARRLFSVVRQLFRVEPPRDQAAVGGRHQIIEAAQRIKANQPQKLDEVSWIRVADADATLREGVSAARSMGERMLLPPIAGSVGHASRPCFRPAVLARRPSRFGGFRDAILLMISPNSEANLLISGGTGTGKTTLLNALAATIPDTGRIAH